MNKLNKQLREQLLKMKKLDQELRLKLPNKPVWDPKIDKIDLENRKKLKLIISKHGWPTIDLVGKRASQGAWLIAQHADKDPDFQKKAFKLIKEAAKDDQVEKKQVAFLTDRILVNQGRSQLYGTQFFYDKNGELIPRPIKSKKDINIRRAEYNLPPMEEYIKTMKSKYN